MYYIKKQSEKDTVKGHDAQPETTHAESILEMRRNVQLAKDKALKKDKAILDPKVWGGRTYGL
ncbi:MAG: hypothetical protein LBL34_05260 [Clostridiales bacterium]|jgi:hypothetical protein|nr:hypothetical protein [Clostridiales bacterium]